MDRVLAIYLQGGPMNGTTRPLDESQNSDREVTVPGSLLCQRAGTAGLHQDAWYRIVDEIRYNDAGAVAVALYVGATEVG